MNNYDNRRYVLLLIFISVSIIFIIRLVYMQLLTDKWHKRAIEISEYKIYTYPPRGIIYDRYGNKLVENKTYYDLMVKASEVDPKMDVKAFCNLLGISAESFEKRINEAKDENFYIPFLFEKQISSEDYQRIEEQLYKYPGFYWQSRTFRGYRSEIASHLLGYIGEISQEELDADTIEKYYRKFDFVGKSGIEKYYEKEFRGKRGVRYILRDAIGMESGKFENGKYDTVAVPGLNIYSTIDPELQAYGEKLMQNKVGSIVAIEPATGEILTMISSPMYDPSLMTGRKKGENYLKLLYNDSLKPLYNRAIAATYPPGSIFKMVQALVGLQEGVIDFNTSIPCNKELVGCHVHPTAANLEMGIRMSCNPYFYKVTQRIIQQGKHRSFFKDSEVGLNIWVKYMHSFGFGVFLDSDIPMPRTGKGFIPDVAFYDKYHGKGRWAFSSIYSIAIGQGEVTVVPLQMANLSAIIANRGYYITPHFVKGISKIGNIPEKYKRKNFTMVDPKFFEPVVEAMRTVVEEAGGTASMARIDGITVCGKTGTAQNPHGEDHSVFIAFAPKDNPKIAISVYVENAGFGGVWAAPIASLMIEKYLRGSVSDSLKEQRIMDAVILNLDPPKGGFTKAYLDSLNSGLKIKNYDF
jgi:penicillin-binding protein 2